MENNLEAREIPDDPVQNIIDDYKDQQDSEKKLLQEERTNREATKLFSKEENEK